MTIFLGIYHILIYHFIWDLWRLPRPCKSGKQSVHFYEGNFNNLHHPLSQCLGRAQSILVERAAFWHCILWAFFDTIWNDKLTRFAWNQLHPKRWKTPVISLWPWLSSEKITGTEQMSTSHSNVDFFFQMVASGCMQYVRLIEHSWNISFAVWVCILHPKKRWQEESLGTLIRSKKKVGTVKRPTWRAECHLTFVAEIMESQLDWKSLVVLLDIAGNVSGNCYTKIDQIYLILGWETTSVGANILILGVLMLMADGQNPSCSWYNSKFFSQINQLVEGLTLA